MKQETPDSPPRGKALLILILFTIVGAVLLTALLDAVIPTNAEVASFRSGLFPTRPDRYYNSYAIYDSDTECPPEYTKNRGWGGNEYATAVFTTYDCPDAVTQRPDHYAGYYEGTIFLQHLKKPVYPSNRLSNYGFESQLSVSKLNLSRVEPRIVSDSVRIEHSLTSDGPPLKIAEVYKNEGKYVTHYSVYYNEKQLPYHLYEKVSFDVLNKGKITHVEKKYKLHGASQSLYGMP